MFASVIRETGGPEALEFTAFPTPDPGPGDILIRQEAVGVNFVDLQHRAGKPYPALPLPLIPGIEAAGTVVATGEDVAHFAVGDRVAYCGAMPGAYATHAVLPGAQAVPIPDGVTAVQAAGVLMQGMTAHYLAHDAPPIMRGDWVLVHAAASGVGRMLVAYAVQRGARVIGTSRNRASLAAIRAAGAVEALLSDAPDFAAHVRAISGGCHAVYDPLGGDHFVTALKCLRARGDLISYGLAAGPVPPFDVARLAGYWDADMAGSIRISRPSLGDFVPDRDALQARAEAVFADHAAGLLPVPRVVTYPLSEAAEAHRAYGTAAGAKIVLLP
jgi:NADPH:quinone reductase